MVAHSSFLWPRHLLFPLFLFSDCFLSLMLSLVFCVSLLWVHTGSTSLCFLLSLTIPCIPPRYSAAVFLSNVAQVCSGFPKSQIKSTGQYYITSIYFAHWHLSPLFFFAKSLQLDLIGNKHPSGCYKYCYILYTVGVHACVCILSIEIQKY